MHAPLGHSSRAQVHRYFNQALELSAKLQAMKYRFPELIVCDRG